MSVFPGAWFLQPVHRYLPDQAVTYKGPSLQFLGSVKGDLANVTAPPFFLAPSSVVEEGHCWAQRPALFAAPAREASAERRALTVLRIVLAAMRSQFYIAEKGNVGIRKPLNAFLGELFLASWTEGGGTTELVAEQVSHHPPITAMHMIDRENGVRADGYARVEMTFSGSGVQVRQVGHAVLRVDRYDEDYLVPLPDVSVHGFLTGHIYPEINGRYLIIGSSGYVSELQFTGAGLFRGKKNSFKGRVYHKDDPKTALYEVAGIWSEAWAVTDCRTGAVIERFDARAPEHAAAPINIAPVELQDEWESRRAWAGVLDALERGNLRDTVREKTKVEQAQRAMRAQEAKTGRTWEPRFFRSVPGEEHTVFHRLAEGMGWKLEDENTKGVWRMRDEEVAKRDVPFRLDMTPLGY